MNITFLIGNGFDLNLGLKTGYTDFYKYYIQQLPDDMIVKSIIKETGTYILLSFLELGLGWFLQEIDVNHIEDFLNSKANLERYLTKYLIQEDKKIFIKDKQALLEEFKNAVINFYKEFSLEERNRYKSYLSSESNSIVYTFINFNYTSSLDKIVEIAAKDTKPFSSHKCSSYTNEKLDNIGNVLHIHGDLNKGIIIGVNDESQIKNDTLMNNTDLTDYIIKSKLNAAIGELKQQTAFEKINNSKYVCVYGLSIGDTDNIWWSKIIEWLIKSPDHKLVLYIYKETSIQYSVQEQVRFSNNQKMKIIDKNIKLDKQTKANIRNQVIVIPNSEIFNFKNIGVKQNGKVENADI